MPAESQIAPISEALIRRARSRLAEAGIGIEDWAIANGFKPSLARQVMTGKRLAIRGDSLKVAIALGLRPDPAAPASSHDRLPPHEAPAGRTLGAGRPVASCDRPPLLHGRAAGAVGEPVR